MKFLGRFVFLCNLCGGIVSVVHDYEGMPEIAEDVAYRLRAFRAARYMPGSEPDVPHRADLPPWCCCVSRPPSAQGRLLRLCAADGTVLWEKVVE